MSTVVLLPIVHASAEELAAYVLARLREGLGAHWEMWGFALGGMSTALELEAILYNALVPDVHDRDVLAVAINERFAEMGGDRHM